MTYEGKRGPRKTKPAPEGRANRARKKEEGKRNVRAIWDDDDARRNKTRPDLRPAGGVNDTIKDEFNHPVDTRKRGIIKLGKRWTEVYRSVENGEMTWEEFAESLDPEELVRGQLKDKQGSFTGRPPTMVPKAFHQACIRELLRRGREMYQSAYLDAIMTFTAIAKDPEVEPKDRLKAAQYIWERLEGKVPEKVEIAAADPWQDIISDIVAEVEDEQVKKAHEYLERKE